MAIERFTEPERVRLRAAGQAAARTLAHVGSRLRAGIPTSEIDRWVREHTRELGGTPSQLGYHGFPATVCTSRNQVVCHGVPSPKDVLEEGDIVNVDVTTGLNGFHGDTSRTFAIGEVSAEARHVMETAQRCMWAGIEVVRPDARLGDIGAAILELAQKEGCSVVTDYGGHGIGRRMHTDPHVPHVGKRGEGMRLKAGMAITIEPMLCLGSNKLRTLDDGWTVVTADGRLSAQFEHTILVTERGYEVMTLLES